jgi:hypothetical protein
MTNDKQLCGIRLEDVLKKRHLDQALNAKEFAVLDGISYSSAQAWFRLPGFPVFRNMVFWQDFVEWRTAQNGSKNHPISQANANTSPTLNPPPRAARLLQEV